MMRDQRIIFTVYLVFIAVGLCSIVVLGMLHR